jgi:transposase
MSVLAQISRLFVVHVMWRCLHEEDLGGRRYIILYILGRPYYYRDSSLESGMTNPTRRHLLEQGGLLHPHPEAVTAPLFNSRQPFFLAVDKVQVKYEMLRAHAVDGLSAAAAAEQHGYSRASFYLITAAFDHAGMRGLLDEPRGRRGPLKLTADVIEFITGADPSLSGAKLALEIEARLGVNLHRRTLERVRR